MELLMLLKGGIHTPCTNELMQGVVMFGEILSAQFAELKLIENDGKQLSLTESHNISYGLNKY
jgi:hypothetical protein